WGSPLRLPATTIAAAERPYQGTRESRRDRVSAPGTTSLRRYPRNACLLCECREDPPDRVQWPWRLEEREDGEGLDNRIRGAHAPAESVVDRRPGGLPDERIGEFEISEQAGDEKLADVDPEGFIKFARAEAAILVRRRELHFEVRRDLGYEVLLLDQDHGGLCQHVTEAALRGGGRGARQFPVALAPHRDAATGEHNVLRSLVE